MQIFHYFLPTIIVLIIAGTFLFYDAVADGKEEKGTKRYLWRTLTGIKNKAADGANGAGHIEMMPSKLAEENAVNEMQNSKDDNDDEWEMVENKAETDANTNGFDAEEDDENSAESEENTEDHQMAAGNNNNKRGKTRRRPKRYWFHDLNNQRKKMVVRFVQTRNRIKLYGMNKMPFNKANGEARQIPQFIPMPLDAPDAELPSELDFIPLNSENGPNGADMRIRLHIGTGGNCTAEIVAPEEKRQQGLQLTACQTNTRDGCSDRHVFIADRLGAIYELYADIEYALFANELEWHRVDRFCDYATMPKLLAANVKHTFWHNVMDMEQKLMRNTKKKLVNAGLHAAVRTYTSWAKHQDTNKVPSRVWKQQQ